MALVLKDRVRETSISTGTGTIDVLGAVTGYQTFGSAIGSGNTCYYTIYNQGTNEWEVGLGTVGSGTLARNTVLSSSNAGSLVNFSAGTKDVFVTYPAEKAVYEDAAGNITPSALVVTSLTDSGLTSGRVTYASTGGLLVDSANLTFNGTTLTSTGFSGPLNGTVGATTPAAGTFTNLAYTGTLTGGTGVVNLGSGQVYKDASGNVGIGTSSPVNRLHVVGASAGAVVARFTDNVNSTIDIQMPSVGLGAIVSAINPLAFNINGSERMRIDSAGNVGIGTSNPSSFLGKVVSVASGDYGAGFVAVSNSSAINWARIDLKNANVATNSYWYKDSSGLMGLYNEGAHALTFGNSNTERMRIDSSGNVGIGRTSTGSRLEVAGRIAASFSNSTTADAGIDLVDSSNTGGNTVRWIDSGGYVANLSQYSTAHATLAGVMTTNNGGGYRWSVNGSERMRIDSSGNVGIGTSSPNTKLEVNGNANATASNSPANVTASFAWADGASTSIYSTGYHVTGNQLVFRQASGTGASPTASLNTNALVRILGIGHTGSAFSGSRAEIAFRCDQDWTTSANGTYMQFNTTANGTTSSSERMRIDSSGNVGIGVAPYDSNVGLAVYRSQNSLLYQDVQNPNTGSSAGAIFRLISSNAAGSSTISADFVKFKTGPLIINNNETNSAAYTGFGVGASERMRIDSSGILILGGTFLSSFGSFGVIPNADGGAAAVVFNRANTTAASFPAIYRNNDLNVGTITYDNTGTSFNTTSDYRLKENIAPMTGALDKVAQLKPVTYKWKADGSDGQGFIAHELQEVVPDAVTGEKDAVDDEGKPIYQGIDTSFLVATLTAAIQELSAKVDTLQAELNTLKGN